MHLYLFLLGPLAYPLAYPLDHLWELLLDHVVAFEHIAASFLAAFGAFALLVADSKRMHVAVESCFVYLASSFVALVADVVPYVAFAAVVAFEHIVVD